MEEGKKQKEEYNHLLLQLNLGDKLTPRLLA
jgi:hypothetical protein